jgi:hypothetical protein
MTTVDPWTDETLAAPPRRRIPGWLCVTCSSLTLVLGLAAGWGLASLREPDIVYPSALLQGRPLPVPSETEEVATPSGPSNAALELTPLTLNPSNAAIELVPQQ